MNLRGTEQTTGTGGSKRHERLSQSSLDTNIFREQNINMSLADSHGYVTMNFKQGQHLPQVSERRSFV